MLKKDKSISISGASIITINGMENTIANMSANIDQNGGISQSSYINNGTVYREHKEEVDADIEGSISMSKQKWRRRNNEKQRYCSRI